MTISASRTFTISKTNFEDSATPSLVLTIDVSSTLPGGAKMAKFLTFEIDNPTSDEIAAFKRNASVTVTVAPAAAAPATATAGTSSSSSAS